MDTIQGRWLLFRKRYVAEDATNGQLHDLKIAFFAGFTVMLNFNHELSALPEPAGVEALALLYDEARRFAARSSTSEACS
ncbi:hypothetical protein [Paraburkholderia sp. 35.1]|uniref:hypothetical protein n=1 Tax=Paraburkholderia sp. 35.1 TaxID=2991058 RepID=UPI003D1B17B4